MPRSIMGSFGARRPSAIASTAAVVVLDPAPVLARAHLLDPFGVIEIPAHRLAQPGRKRLGRRPAELVAQLGRVDGVAQIVPRAVLDERDQRLELGPVAAGLL